RDKLVTGVQTCALPISRAVQPTRTALYRKGASPFQKADRARHRAHVARSRAVRAARASDVQRNHRGGLSQIRMVQTHPDRVQKRSEERRVGKECRSARK